MPKLPLRKSLREEGNLAGIADKRSGGRMKSFRPSTGFSRVSLAPGPAPGTLRSRQNARLRGARGVSGARRSLKPEGGRALLV
jgi:hypothetical protein